MGMADLLTDDQVRGVLLLINGGRVDLRRTPKRKPRPLRQLCLLRGSTSPIRTSSTLVSVDPYNLEQWHNFFAMVGGGAVVLTGLGVVAMSLHLDAVVRHAALKNRAREVLTALAGVFIRCALVLMGGQSGQAVAFELFAVCAVVGASGLAGFWQGVRDPEPTPRGVIFRVVGHTACYVVEMIGAVLLFLGFQAGLYVVGVAMLSNFYFLISESWLLLLGVA